MLLAGCLALMAAPADFPSPAQLPVHPALPDPLVLRDGRKVESEKTWREERRPELKALFQHYMYGHLPPPPKRLQATVDRQDTNYFGGKATLKEITLAFGPSDAPAMHLLLVVPNQSKAPVPVVVGLNFCGNHTMLPDREIALPTTWMPSFCKACVDHQATEAGRGLETATWCIHNSIDRGYAIAAFYNGDLEPDRPDAPSGIRAYARKGGLAGSLGAPQPEAKCPACPGRYESGDYDWSTIGAWAWGLHRAVDYLVTDPSIDAKRIAVFGHSRNGKTALLAGAFDERIALILCHQAGCGGSAPSRGKIGESVQQINDRFPHWFNAQFKEFNRQPERLPFDQHELIALCAPRPVLLSNATEDTWANPEGQFAMLQAARPVYQLFGLEGIKAQRMPEPGQLINSPLGYFLRAGKHSTTCEDWAAFLDFADRQLGQPLAPGK